MEEFYILELKKQKAYQHVVGILDAKNNMKGVDLSHWNGRIDFKKVRESGFEFAIIKCTESTNFFDNRFLENKKYGRANGLLMGYYHFARGGNYKTEADWFLSKVGDLKEGELVVLDYEIANLINPADWCEKWLSYVESKIGFKPLLYTYHSLLNYYNWKKVSDGDFGLWAARYGRQEQEPNNNYRPATGSWKFYAIWQYSSRGKVNGIIGNVDLNYTGMNLETLKKYGAKEIKCNHQCPKCCK